ncbi:MAG: riboflavin synthase [Synergistaceae bacterium]|nr:riboflavin synthase [Synergistaceae bacterium]
MFTGLIETVGTIAAVQQKGDVWQLDISAPEIAAELHLGDSVSVSGACNTVVRYDAQGFSVEMMEETRNRTKLGRLKRGSHVNLERAMRFDSRLGGHLVAGHVDGTAQIVRIEAEQNTRKYFFAASPEILSGIVPKGSVAIDGISLTVIHVDESTFSAGIIPTTLTNTTLPELKTGDDVNIETDMIGKFVKSFLDARFSDKDGNAEVKNSLTWDKLVQYGWA